jgi:uncharacterized BrkB/YihY/UPF0761 family membrane protein
MIASAGFAFYVADFASYNETYGTMAGVIVFLIWLWISNLAILLGLEFDAETPATPGEGTRKTGAAWTRSGRAAAPRRRRRRRRAWPVICGIPAGDELDGKDP